MPKTQTNPIATIIKYKAHENVLNLCVILFQTKTEESIHSYT